MNFFWILFVALFYSFSCLGMAYHKATFAGGCFWCIEAVFQELEGVESVVSGYSGGIKKSPTYKEVSSGETLYLEAVQIKYNPKRISFKRLLEIYWMNIDPTDSTGQFVDRGHQYTAAIFYHNPLQKLISEQSKNKVEKKEYFKKKIKTVIRPFENFFKAEAYHQDYYKKSKKRYLSYKKSSGRIEFYKKYWKNKKFTFDLKFNFIKKYKVEKKPELKKRLTNLQYNVTQENGTERAFSNEYWDNKEEGIYIDRVSEDVLFSSKDKYKSGTGWPSFKKPISDKHIKEVNDSSFGMNRIEVKSTLSNSHLGHVFKDGPLPLGLRYCINSASLVFIPKHMLKEKGLKEYLMIFE